MGKKGRDYFITDLCIDFWITPTGRFFELDLDEFGAACGKGLISEALSAKAQESFKRVRNEAETGLFPRRYIDDSA